MRYDPAVSESSLKPHFFEREDESPDPLFYREPRLLVHIDDPAIDAVRRLYEELLPHGGSFLDLMASYRSHMPESLQWQRLAGLGLNEVELRENPQLTDYAVHDINAEPSLPYGDEEFDGVVITVSVQYLTKPVEVFREVRRVLKPGGPLVVTYSNRMFPEKAVRIWRALDDADRGTLIAIYFRHAGGFDDPEADDRTPDIADYHDPVYAVWARRSADAS